MPGKALLSGLLLLAALVWGGSFVVVRFAVAQMDPVILGAARFIVATPLMFLILFVRRSNLRIPRKEWVWLAVLGLTGVTFLYIFQYVGIAYTNASISSVLTETDVLFIALFSILFLGEAATRLRILGILLSFAGVVIVILSNLDFAAVTVNSLFLLGAGLVILSSLCWGIFSIISKRLFQTYDMITVTTYSFALGTLFYLPIVAGSLVPSLQQTSLLGWSAILYLAIVSTIVAYIAWNYALAHMDASQAGVYLTFIPLFTLLIAIPLGERMMFAFFLGAGLIILGVYLAQEY